MSSSGAPPRAVLDTNVIFSRVLHELMGRVGTDARLLDLIWSDELIREAIHALRDYRQLSQEVAEKWAGYLASSFPAGRVETDGLTDEVDLSTLTDDPGDQFVCALAIVGHADLLFTFDRGYLREPLAQHGVAVLSPDVWLADAVQIEPDLFVELVTRQASVWAGGRPVVELIDAYERAKAPVFAARMRDLV